MHCWLPPSSLLFDRTLLLSPFNYKLTISITFYHCLTLPLSVSLLLSLFFAPHLDLLPLLIFFEFEGKGDNPINASTNFDQERRDMMHRCSSSQGNMAGPCTCGLFHSQGNSFSMLFSMPNHKPFDETDMYPFTSSSSSSSSVDCTLSLGTPSTRLTDNDEKRMHHDRRSGSCVSNFCWDILQSKHTPSAPTNKPSRGGNSGGGGNSSGGDPLLARRCANCDTTSTPLWRNGPRGPKVIDFSMQPMSFFFFPLPFHTLI